MEACLAKAVEMTLRLHFIHSNNIDNTSSHPVTSINCSASNTAVAPYYTYHTPTPEVLPTNSPKTVTGQAPRLNHTTVESLSRAFYTSDYEQSALTVCMVQVYSFPISSLVASAGSHGKAPKRCTVSA